MIHVCEPLLIMQLLGKVISKANPCIALSQQIKLEHVQQPFQPGDTQIAAILLSVMLVYKPLYVPCWKIDLFVEILQVSLEEGM